MNAIKYALIGLAGIIGVMISIFGIRVPFAESLAKEHWRAGLVALLLIILSIPAAFSLFIYFFDANRFKSDIIQYVKEHTQRELVLQGDIRVTFFPKLGLDSGRISLSQRNSAKEFASIGNARLFIAWLPLLHKQLVFDHVEIDGARANFTRFKDGTTNIDDLLIRDESLSPLTFDIDSVRITNSAINWQDEIKWKRFAVQDLQIETGRLADTIPGQITAKFHLNSEMMHSDSSVGIKSRLFFDRKSGRYEFADIDGTIAGTVAGFSNLELKFSGNLESHPAQELLQAENILVTSKGNYGQRSFDARLSLPKLQYSKSILNGSQFTLDTAISQFDEKWTTSVQMPSFEYANNNFKAETFSTDFEFKGEGRSLQGKLSSPARADFETSPKLLLGNVALNLSIKHPMLSGEFFSTGAGSMQADLTEQSVNLNLSGKFDDSKFSGVIALKDFNHPECKFDIKANRIDLDRYISADWIRRYQTDATQIDPGSFKNLTLVGRLRADELKAAKLKASKLTANIRIDKSSLALSPLSASLYGGTLTSSFSIAALDTPQVSFKQNLKGFNAGALFADTAGVTKLAGKGDLAIDISAEGGNIGALRKTLNGNISLALARGSLAGIDLRSVLIKIKDDLGIANIVHTREARFSERTDFTDLKSTINFKDGISHGNIFDLRSPLFRISGEGDLAIESGNINYQLDATVSGTLNRRNAGELSVLKGVNLPIIVSGPWASPTINLDVSAARGGIVSTRIAEKAEAEKVAAKTAEQAATKAAAQQSADTLSAKKRATPSKSKAGKSSIK